MPAVRSAKHDIDELSHLSRTFSFNRKIIADGAPGAIGCHHPLGPHSFPRAQRQPYTAFAGLNGNDFGTKPDSSHWLLLQSLQQNLLGPGLWTMNRLARGELTMMSRERHPPKFFAHERFCPDSQPSSFD